MKALHKLGRPWVVTMMVATAYLFVLLQTADWDPLVLVRIGTKFAEHDPNGSIGYDGQFYYYIAQDPQHGWRYIDNPAYRYQRILYPMLVRIISLGNERMLPWAMLGINLASLVGGVAVIEILLSGEGVSPWYALSVGLYGGQLFAVVACLSEPLALCLALVAMLLFARGHQMWSGLLFSLAVLAKETTLILAAGYLVYLIRKREFRHSFLMGAVVGIPFIFWQSYLGSWLGTLGVDAVAALATSFNLVPFGGLISVASVSWRVFLAFAVILIPVIIVPTAWAILSTGRDILQQKDHPWTFALALFAIVIPFLPASALLDLSAMPRFVAPLVALTVLYAAHSRDVRALRTCLLWITTMALVPSF